MRIYLEEELDESAASLMGKPLLFDHYLVLPPPNRVIYATYGDGGLEYVAEVGDEVARMVQDGLIKHCSVEFDWERLEKMDGVAPRGIEFTGLSRLKGRQTRRPDGNCGTLGGHPETSERRGDTRARWYLSREYGCGEAGLW